MYAVIIPCFRSVHFCLIHKKRQFFIAPRPHKRFTKGKTFRAGIQCCGATELRQTPTYSLSTGKWAVGATSRRSGGVQADDPMWIGDVPCQLSRHFLLILRIRAELIWRRASFVLNIGTSCSMSWYLKLPSPFSIICQV